MRPLFASLFRIAIIVCMTTGAVACSHCNRCIQSLPPETAEPQATAPPVIPPPRPF
jgi:hypothetical protein